MFGLKLLKTNTLFSVFVILSAALVLSGSVLAPSAGAPVVASVLWIAAAAVFLGLWVGVAVELSRRYYRGDTLRGR